MQPSTGLAQPSCCHAGLHPMTLLHNKHQSRHCVWMAITPLQVHESDIETGIGFVAAASPEVSQRRPPGWSDEKTTLSGNCISALFPARRRQPSRRTEVCRVVIPYFDKESDFAGNQIRTPRACQHPCAIFWSGLTPTLPREDKRKLELHKWSHRTRPTKSTSSQLERKVIHLLA